MQSKHIHNLHTPTSQSIKKCSFCYTQRLAADACLNTYNIRTDNDEFVCFQASNMA